MRRASTQFYTIGRSVPPDEDFLSLTVQGRRITENRSQYVDPLGVVEEIYADFGCPDEIRHLVRYNPADQAAPQTEDGIMRRWSEYLGENLPSPPSP